MDGIGPNFAYQYSLTLTRSRCGVLYVNFHKYTTQLWPLFMVKISFPLNIFLTNRWNLIKFCKCIEIYQFLVWILKRQFSQIYKRVMSFGDCQKMVSTQYLVNNLIEFEQILQKHSP